MKFEFKDGTTLEGEIVAQALWIILIKSAVHYYIISKFALKDEDE